VAAAPATTSTLTLAGQTNSYQTFGGFAGTVLDFGAWTGFATPSVAGTGQTAHPFTQVMGFAVVESAPAASGVGGPRTPDRVAALLDSESASVLPTAPLQVRGVTVSGSGLHVRFNQAFDGRSLLADGGLGSHVVVMRDKLAIRGRVVLDADGEGFVFMADTALLPEGAYTFRLLSGRGGFAKPDGEPLDGNYDGRAGGDFLGSFNVLNSAMGLSLMDRDLVEPGLSQSQQFDLSLALAGDIDWIAQRWSAELDAADDFWTSVTAGAGGLLILAAGPETSEKDGARRMSAVRAGRGGADDDGEQPIRIGKAAAATSPLPIPKAPAWILRWLGQHRAGVNDWQIRL